jgi:putative endonuclease
MATAYILYSKTLDKFYTGSCKEFDFRLLQHLQKVHNGAFTSAADDWVLFLKMDDLSYEKARKIESKIKKMKSKKYILNLNKYPELLEKLIKETWSSVRPDSYRDGPPLLQSDSEMSRFFCFISFARCVCTRQWRMDARSFRY